MLYVCFPLSFRKIVAKIIPVPAENFPVNCEKLPVNLLRENPHNTLKSSWICGNFQPESLESVESPCFFPVKQGKPHRDRFARKCVHHHSAFSLLADVVGTRLASQSPWVRGGRSILSGAYPFLTRPSHASSEKSILNFTWLRRRWNSSRSCSQTSAPVIDIMKRIRQISPTPFYLRARRCSHVPARRASRSRSKTRTTPGA